MQDGTNPQPTPPEHIVVEDIARLMTVGKPVFDMVGKKIGDVRQFDLTAGYLQVHHGGPEHQTLYIPFNLITSIDDREIYLYLPERMLEENFALLPASQVVLKQWTNWRSGRTQTTTGHSMFSGYTGEPVVAFQHTYDALAWQLVEGMHVHDVEGANLGTVRQFDSVHGWLTAQKGTPGASLTLIPFSAIARVETSSNTVVLLVYEEELHRDLARLLPAPPPAETEQPKASAAHT
jgi:hypothetical protein